MSNRPVLSQLNIVSRDPAASIAFYRHLGVDIPEAMVWATASGIHHVSAGEGMDGAGIAFDIDSVAFAQIWNSGWKGRADLAGRVVVTFYVAAREDVDRIFGDMTAGGHRGLQQPYDAFWGARYAIIEDPDGIAVGLMSPISSEMKAPPPDV